MTQTRQELILVRTYIVARVTSTTCFFFIAPLWRDLRCQKRCFSSCRGFILARKLRFPINGGAVHDPRTRHGVNYFLFFGRVHRDPNGFTDHESNSVINGEYSFQRQRSNFSLPRERNLSKNLPIKLD